MVKKILIGAFLGAIIVYIWAMISWMLLPWHNKTLKSFKSEAFVSWVIKENAPKKGIYTIPSLSSEKKHSEDLKKSPFVFAAVTPKGINPKNPYPYIFTYLFEFIGAGILTYVLLQLKPEIGYFPRVWMAALFGLFAGLVSETMYWSWWQFPLKFVGLGVADLIISWFLAGLVLAKISRHKVVPSNV